jgi:predicted oxidoreductase
METRREFLTYSVLGGVLGAVGTSAPVTAAESPIQTSHADAGMTTIPRTDLKVSRLAFGARNISMEADGLNLLNAVYDSGINFFDLSNLPGEEEPFGIVLRQTKGLRNKLVIQSKCGLVPEKGRKLNMDCSGASIVRAAEGSLRRLGIDHLDLLLLHWPDPLVEPEEVASAFSALRKSGKVRYFGVSNHVPSQIELLSRFLDEPLVANQIYLSLENSYLIAGGIASISDVTRHAYNYVGAAPTIDYCRMNRMQLQAWSPLRGELLNPSATASPEMKAAHQVLREVAAEKGVSASAVALAWLLRHPAGIVPIIGGRNSKHVADNAAAVRVGLSISEWYRLLDATVNIRSRAPT